MAKPIESPSAFKLYLNSTSPRRKDILTKILRLIDPKLNINIVKPTFAEDLDKTAFANSKDYLLENTKKKCDDDVVKRVTAETKNGTDIILVSADTILTDSHYSRILEKPNDLKHNYDMLVEQIKDGSIICMTSVQITHLKDGIIIKQVQTLAEAIIVLDKDLLENCGKEFDLIQRYVETLEGMEAAGGFKIQEHGSFMVKKIDGDFYTVVGLPFNSTLISMIDIIKTIDI